MDPRDALYQLKYCQLLHNVFQKIPSYHKQIRYDTRCYFNVRSKADMSQLNLLHENDN